MDITPDNAACLRKRADRTIRYLKDNNIVGRHADCDIVLADQPGASRKHARITRTKDAYLLTDLGSLNGTLVNGFEINRTVQLYHGDVLVFDTDAYDVLLPELHATADAVTIIADRDEAANPGRIKPAIRPVQHQHANRAVQPAWPARAQYDNEPFEHMAIPATSRPGGDLPARTKRSGTGLLAVSVALTLVGGAMLAAYLSGTGGMAK